MAGLPKPRSNHAIIMCRFANACLHKMQDLTKILAADLGPDTCDLCFRVGLHSGPVTAGVLRGDKGRFQLFGDVSLSHLHARVTLNFFSRQLVHQPFY